MPMIRVEMFAGRIDDQKRPLVKELSEAFTRVAGGNADGVEVMLVDVGKNNRSRGGALFSQKE